MDPSAADNDLHMEADEVIFAQRLASGEPAHRHRALKLLREYIVKQSTGQNEGMGHESLRRLCKGLHYVLWMQDKMLMHEEIANVITGGLMEAFTDDEQTIAYIQTMFRVLSKEWPLIDQWRMDKFLMLIRRFFRAIFTHLAKSNWEETHVKPYLIFIKELVDNQSSLFESLKYHCAAVFLDELETAAEQVNALEWSTLEQFLGVYIELLGTKISDRYFQCTCTEVFDPILHDFSEQIAVKEDNDGENDQKQGKGLQFNYQRISELLFAIGKRHEVNSKRRKRIYELSKKFDAAAQGIDPHPSPEDADLKMLLTRKRKKHRKLRL